MLGWSFKVSPQPCRNGLGTRTNIAHIIRHATHMHCLSSSNCCPSCYTSYNQVMWFDISTHSTALHPIKAKYESGTPLSLEPLGPPHPSSAHLLCSSPLISHSLDMLCFHHVHAFTGKDGPPQGTLGSSMALMPGAPGDSADAPLPCSYEDRKDVTHRLSNFLHTSSLLFKLSMAPHNRTLQPTLTRREDRGTQEIA